jgi:hypothetical protein
VYGVQVKQKYFDDFVQAYGVRQQLGRFNTKCVKLILILNYWLDRIHRHLSNISIYRGSDCCKEFIIIACFNHFRTKIAYIFTQNPN